MSSPAHTWARERLVPAIYDLAVQNRAVVNIAGRVLWGLDVRKMFASISRIRQEPVGARVLDVPCGGGLVFDALRPSHGLTYVALDLSPVMLARAQSKMARLGLKGISVQQGEVGQLAFENASFDLCLTYNGLHCVPDPELAIRELARVLRSSGRLRGSVIVRDAGSRSNAMIRFLQRRSLFGPVYSQAQIIEWLVASGLVLLQFEQSGALFLFEAIKDQAP